MQSEVIVRAYWHFHHDEGPLEWSEGTYASRVAEIRKHKPEHEHELRLRLFKPVVGPLPRPVQNALIELDRTVRLSGVGDCNNPDNPDNDAFNAAQKAWDRAVYQCTPEIFALHQAECPNCPWDGKSIFSV